MDVDMMLPHAAPAAPEAPPIPPGGARHLVLPEFIFFGTGFVVHGLGLHFSNNTRTGLVLEDNKTPVNLHDSYRMPHRANQRIDLLPGEVPTTFNGFSSLMGFLAYQVEFITSINSREHRTLAAISGTDIPNRGEQFHYTAPLGHYIKDVWWQAGRPTQVYLAATPSTAPGLTTVYQDIGWTPMPRTGGNWEPE